MTSDTRLFKIDPVSRQSKAVKEVDFTELGFQERRDIQEWIVDNPSILGEELLVIGKEFNGFDRTNERADIVAVDRDGKVVIIELKRDDTGADVHWQAIKYASYFHHARVENIVLMLADHTGISEIDAQDKLKHHLNTDDLDILNNDQRVILVSHRFAPEVTSAVLWLNQKTSSEDLITCIQLTPFYDSHTQSMYIQASTIIPVPGTDDFTIKVGASEPRIMSAIPIKKEDEITWFLRDAAAAAVNILPEKLRTDKKSRWAGIGGDHRYYHVWYSRSPWSNWGMSYHLRLFEGIDSEPIKVVVGFSCLKEILISKEGFSEEDFEVLKDSLEKLSMAGEQKVYDDERWLNIEGIFKASHLGTSLNAAVAEALRRFIESITPVIEQLENSRNE